jgi:hypothetical protein
LCAIWQQNIGYVSEAPISKHQIPNNIQIQISNDPNGFVSEFGPAFGGIGNYLEFGYWDFPALAGFGSGYAGLGFKVQGLPEAGGASWGLALYKKGGERRALRDRLES